MEVSLFAGRRMSGRAAGGNDRIQDAAGALGERVDPGLQENTPQGVRERRIAASENRSLVSPDGQSQLSADDRALGFAAARHGDSLLSGMVPDALHRPAPVPGFDVFYFQLLFGFAEGTVSEKLAALAALPATVDVVGNRADGHQYDCRAGSAGGQADRLRPDSQVPRRIEDGQGRREKIPQTSGMGSMDRTPDRNLFRFSGLLRHRQRKLHHGSLPAVVRDRLLGHRADVTAAGPVPRTLGGFGKPPQAIPGRRVDH